MLEGLTPPDSRLPCKVRSIFEKLSEEDTSILQAALRDESAWNATNLAKALCDRGLQVGDGAIRKHRRSECSCK